MLKDRFPKQAVGNFTDGFSGLKSFRDFRETGPCSQLSCFIAQSVEYCTGGIAEVKGSNPADNKGAFD